MQLRCIKNDILQEGEESFTNIVRNWGREETAKVNAEVAQHGKQGDPPTLISEGEALTKSGEDLSNNSRLRLDLQHSTGE